MRATLKHGAMREIAQELNEDYQFVVRTLNTHIKKLKPRHLAIIEAAKTKQR